MNANNNDASVDIARIRTYQSATVQASAHRLLTRALNSFLEPYDLTATQWFMIGHIYDSGEAGVKLTDLMHILDTKLPFITNSVNMLESRNIVVKSPHATDNRVKLVTIHPKYRRHIMKIENHVREELRTKLYADSHITRDELSTYISVLYKMIQSTKK